MCFFLCPSHFPFTLLPAGDFTKRHSTNRWSQREHRTSSLPDLSDNPRGFDPRRGVHRLQAERSCRREKCWFAVEGQTVSWAQGGGCRVPTEPPPLLSLAHRSSPLAPGGAELLAPHGQRLQCLYVAEGDRAGGKGWGERERWDTDPSPRPFYAWSPKLVLRIICHFFPEESNPPAAESHHSSSQARLVEEGLIHILSMGSKALMLQVWADFSTGSLTFRWAPG